tara:strand:- start:1602 stop:3416 length:1815 start_codon:yes stop_codon:yes gene_type:complete
MRISDFIINKLSVLGIDTCFMVTGGGALFINDSLFKNKKIKKYFCHHEQACSIAAESFYRCSLKPALVQVTTGPASINALNGVYGAFVDSIPMIVLSGQVRTDNISYLSDKKLRQFGDQEVRISEIAKSITKKSITINDFNLSKINKTIEEMFSISINGRKGPVWIDVPIDIQGKIISEKKKSQLYLINKTNKINRSDSEYNKYCKVLINKLQKSKRPVVICGNGIRFSNSIKNLHKLISILKIPLLSVWNAHDLVPNDNKYYCGRPGADGERAGNFVIQNCDLLIILGARMHVRQVGFNYKEFAPKAYKIMVDIDKSELNKKNLLINLKINAEIHKFLNDLILNLDNYKPKTSHKLFLDWSLEKVKKFPVFDKKFFISSKNKINPYVFLNTLFERLPSKSTVVTGDGTAAVITFKIAKIRKNQRLFTNKGSASMGYDLPALFGAIVSNKEKQRRFYCITGDGSIMMNIQELQTLSTLKKNFTIFVLNNDGYHSIRQTQKNFFNTEIGCGPSSGITFPRFELVAKTFNLKYYKICNINDLKKIDEIIINKKKNICEIFIDKKQMFEPRLVSYKDKEGNLVSPPLHDMTPRLSEKLIKDNMISED